MQTYLYERENRQKISDRAIGSQTWTKWDKCINNNVDGYSSQNTDDK